MPNHITNVLRINAYKHEGVHPERIDELRKLVRSTKRDEDGKDYEMPFDFEMLIPMPPELMITSGSVSGDAKALYDDHEAHQILGYPWAREALISTIGALRDHLRARYLEHPEPGLPTLDDFAERIRANVAKHGAEDWYRWCVEKWGTKWNAYDCTVGKTGDGEVQYTFDTAWSPPLPVLDVLAAKFPDLHFRLAWTDEGDNVAHRVYWSDGKREGDEDEETPAPRRKRKNKAVRS